MSCVTGENQEEERTGTVSMQLIDVQWGRLRPGVTILRGDGRLERATSVEHRDHTTLVWFDDGRLERHEDSEPARVLTRAS